MNPLPSARTEICIIYFNSESVQNAKMQDGHLTAKHTQDHDRRTVSESAPLCKELVEV